jgi:hypothetical protein
MRATAPLRCRTAGSASKGGEDALKLGKRSLSCIGIDEEYRTVLQGYVLYESELNLK